MAGGDMGKMGRNPWWFKIDFMNTRYIKERLKHERIFYVLHVAITGGQ